MGGKNSDISTIIIVFVNAMILFYLLFAGGNENLFDGILTLLFFAFIIAPIVSFVLSFFLSLIFSAEDWDKKETSQSQTNPPKSEYKQNAWEKQSQQSNAKSYTQQKATDIPGTPPNIQSKQEKYKCLTDDELFQKFHLQKYSLPEKDEVALGESLMKELTPVQKDWYEHPEKLGKFFW